MKKSVYSLVLMDDVVEEIDRLAYERKTNRSNLINQILAESIGFITPEMKMRDIFRGIEEILSENCYQVLERSSDSIFSVRSAIRYKYRPTVKYSVELFRDSERTVGRLKVSFRTSSKAFTDSVQSFFQIWMHIEEEALRKFYQKGVTASLDQAKFERVFIKIDSEKNLSETDIAGAIGVYIKIIDRSIKIYFENIDRIGLISASIFEAYNEYLSLDVNLV